MGTADMPQKVHLLRDGGPICGRKHLPSGYVLTTVPDEVTCYACRSTLRREAERPMPRILVKVRRADNVLRPEESTMTTAKKTKAPKRKAPATAREIAPASLAVGGRIVIKVLQKGRSWHNRRNHYEWPLPTQNADGSWVPGAWTPKVDIVYCESGYHGTNCAPRWWGADAVAWWMEYHPDAKIIRPEEAPEHQSEGNKFCGEQCRLLRPLNRAELEEQGVYLTGEHEKIGEDGKFYALGGDVKVETLRGGTVTYLSGGTVTYLSGGTVTDMRGGTVTDMRGGTVTYLSGGTVTYLSGGTVTYLSGGTVTAHADSDAVIVVRYGSPIVTLRGRSSLLDYRQGRPVHHLADAGQVIAFGANGGVVKRSEAEHADATKGK